MENTTTQAVEALNGFEAWLAPIFSKFPHIPEGGQKVIVSIAPWIALVFGILGLISIVTGGALLSLMGLFTMGFAMMYLIQLLVSLIVSLAAVVLLLLAFPGLRDRKKAGWNYVFYSQVASLAGSVLMVLFSFGISYAVPQFLMTLVWTTVGFWLLFEIRSHYSLAGAPAATAPAAPASAPEHQ